MNLTRLIYASTALPGINFASLQQILSTAETKNLKKTITGALVYGSGYFLQILEGNRSDISALYNHISQDKRHSEVELLEVMPIQTRDFEQWSMRYVRYDDQNNSSHHTIVKKITQTDKFVPKLWTAEQSRAVLIELSP
jgi:uncharacterized protein YdiU (UPF0061 family)